MYKIIMLGPPGSGKGSQAEILAERLNIPTISTGDIFRAEVKNKTDLGKKIESILAAGNLIEDETTNQIVKKRLAELDTKKGFILDGYPRDLNQAEFLDKHIEVNLVLNINSSDQTVTDRMKSRRMCKECRANFNILSKPPKQEGICDKCGGELYIRADAEPAAIKERLSVYHGLIDPLLSYYKAKGILLDIDGEPMIQEVWEEIKNKLSL